MNEDTSFITLLGDNINKIPRDLSEVGPQDKSFRSSIGLYGRVQNNGGDNSQFFPGRTTFNTTSIEDLFTLFDISNFKNSFNDPIPITNPLNAFHGFFKSESDPFVAEISTSKDSNLQFGANNSVLTQAGTALANANVTNEITLPVDTVTGVIEIGSIITSIAGVPLTGTVDYVVINTTGDSTPTLTLNREITLAINDALTFSLETYKDIATLAVYETEPVASSLDIFWESSTSGLISDLNEDVLTGFTGIVDVQQPTFNYYENQNPQGTGTTVGASNSKIITSWFFPTDSEGLEMRNTGALATAVPSDYSGPIFSATRGTFATPTDGFAIEQNITPTDINVNPNFGAYRIVLSDTNNSYNHFAPPSTGNSNYFSFSVKLLNPSGGSYSNTNSFNTEIKNNNPFLNSLADRDQSISATLPVKTLPPDKNPTSGGVISTLGAVGYAYTESSLLNISNGAKYYANNNNYKSDVYTYLDEVPKKRLGGPTDFSPFYINHSTGAVGIGYFSNDANPGINGGVMVGEYVLKVKAKDAMSNSGGNGNQRIDDRGTNSQGTLQSSVYTQKIVLQAPSLNQNFGTSCIATGFSGSNPRRGAGDTGSGNSRYWQWYISENSIGNSNKPSGANAVVGSSFGSYAPVSLSSVPFRSTNSAGTMLLDLMFEAKRKSSNTATPVSGFHCTWKVWYRSHSTESWSLDTVRDTNNTNLNNSINNNSPLALAAPSSYAANVRSAINVPVAFDKKGDYFIEAELVNADYQSFGSSAPTEAEVWVNCTDANYPTSFIVDGKNIIEEEGSGEDSDYFAYTYSTANSGTTAGGCQQTLNNTVYARTPYAHIVTEFFSDTALTTKPVINSSGQYKAYQYSPGSSSYNDVREKRTAKISNMTQSSSTNGSDYDFDNYKTNNNFIYTATSGGYSGTTVYRKKCNASGESSTTQFGFYSYTV